MAVMLMLAACRMRAAEETAIPGPQYEPQPGDSGLTHGQVFLDVVELQTMESSPPQFSLALRGSLPTPCHQLRVVVSPPDLQTRVVVEAYSLARPDTSCAQVLEPFAADIMLGTYPTGHYILVVNGEEVAEFDA
jgi:hypothetical protein